MKEHDLMNKVVITDEYHIQEMIQKARRGETVTIIGLGNSMRPLLKDGCTYINLTAIKKEDKLKKRDLVFYKSHTGNYVLHRIFKVEKAGCYMLGDGNLTVEPLVTWPDIYLKATHIIKNDISRPVTSWRYRSYGFIWTSLFPVRRYFFTLERKLWVIYKYIIRR